MLTMKKADYEKILAHAKENLPEEACGLIAGNQRRRQKDHREGVPSGKCGSHQ